MSPVATARMGRTFGETLRSGAAAWGGKTAFETLGGKAVSFGELDRRVNALNNAVARLGVRKGSRVALLAKNCPEYIEVYGLSKSGLIVVPLNWRLAAGELTRLVEHSAPAVLVVDEHHRALAESIRDQLPSVKHFIVLGVASAGWQAYEDLLAMAPESEPTTLAEPDDVLCLIYTSGTTGAPRM